MTRQKTISIALTVIIGTVIFAASALLIEIPVDSRGEYISWSSLPLAFIYADLVPGRPAAGIPALCAHLMLSFGIPWLLIKLVTAGTKE